MNDANQTYQYNINQAYLQYNQILNAIDNAANNGKRSLVWKDDVILTNTLNALREIGYKVKIVDLETHIISW